MDRFIRMVKKANKIGLKLNPYKTTVYAETVAFTGFQVSSDGLIPLPRNRTKILSFPYSRLQYKSDWQAFEGGILFLNEYIIDLAEDLNHLRALLISKAESEKIKAQHPTWSIKQRNRRTRLRHSNESRAVFKQLLDKVSSIPILHHPDLCADGGCFVVKTDASMHGAGSSLWQMRGDSLVLIKLWSKNFTKCQYNYGSTEREALGVYLTLIHWKKYLLIKPFIVRGDHKPLSQIYGLDYTQCANKKLLRWICDLQEYRFEFQYCRGDSIDIAMEDYISRLVCVKSDGLGDEGDAQEAIQNTDIFTCVGYESNDDDFKQSYHEITAIAFDPEDEFYIHSLEYKSINHVARFKYACSIENMNNIKHDDITNNPIVQLIREKKELSSDALELKLKESNSIEIMRSINKIQHNSMIETGYFDGIYEYQRLMFEVSKMYFGIEELKPLKLSVKDTHTLNRINKTLEDEFDLNQFVSAIISVEESNDRVLRNLIIAHYNQLSQYLNPKHVAIQTRSRSRATCPICNKVVTNKAVQCENKSCQQWWHMICLKPSSQELNVLINAPNTITFICPKCEPHEPHPFRLDNENDDYIDKELQSKTDIESEEQIELKQSYEETPNTTHSNDPQVDIRQSHLYALNVNRMNHIPFDWTMKMMITLIRNYSQLLFLRHIYDFAVPKGM
eukprot:207913_1